MKKQILICLLSIIPSSLFAQPICDQFLKAIDDNLKYISLLDAMGSGKNDSDINTQQLIQVSLIQSNLFLMKESKCSLPKFPIDKNLYRKNAYACTGAFINLPRGAGSPPECNRDLWTKTEK